MKMTVGEAANRLNLIAKFNTDSKSKSAYKAINMGSSALLALSDLELQFNRIADADCYNDEQRIISKTYSDAADAIHKIIEGIEDEENSD